MESHHDTNTSCIHCVRQNQQGIWNGKTKKGNEFFVLIVIDCELTLRKCAIEIAYLLIGEYEYNTSISAFVMITISHLFDIYSFSGILLDDYSLFTHIRVFWKKCLQRGRAWSFVPKFPDCEFLALVLYGLDVENFKWEMKMNVFFSQYLNHNLVHNLDLKWFKLSKYCVHAYYYNVILSDNPPNPTIKISILFIWPKRRGLEYSCK